MTALRFRAVIAFVALSLLVFGGCPGLNGTETTPTSNTSASVQSATQAGGNQTPADPSDFTPATGKAAPPPNAPVTYGPWNVRLRVATSPDGLTWTRTGVTITDQGDVPSVIAADGKLWVFYVIWRDAGGAAGLVNTTVAAYSADLVHWTFKQLQFTGSFPTGYTTTPVDPTVVAVSGGYRMYFTLGPLGATTQDKAHTFSAFSTDLLNWTFEGSRLAVTGEEVLDPSLVWAGDHYEFFGGTQHATSPDGLSFSYAGRFSMPELPGLIPSNGARIGGAYKYYSFVDVPAGSDENIRTLTYDAGAWRLDAGVRLAVDTSTGAEVGLVRDPAVCVHPAGEQQGYVMVYVTGIP